MAVHGIRMLVVFLVTAPIFVNLTAAQKCNSSEFRYVDYDVDKFQDSGYWYIKFMSTSFPGAPVYQGRRFDFSYTTSSDGNVTIQFDMVRVNSTDEDCEVDEIWTCQLGDDYICRSNVEYGLLATDFDSQYGSLVMVFGGIVIVYVKDPFNFSNLNTALTQAGLREACGEGADDYRSGFWAVENPYAKVPACLFP